MRRAALLFFAFILAACSAPAPSPQNSFAPDLAKDDVVSGYTFLTAESQALQDDPFANPGYLWVESGEALFTARPDSHPSCTDCHAAGLPSIAASYPKIDAESGVLVNLEGRINLCRTRHQNQPALPYESDDLLALTAYVANQSLGEPVTVTTDHAEARAAYERGKTYFQTRRGQFNLSCQQCHTGAWGQKLRGDTISQGHPNGFPAYRLEWQTLGSLHRRLRDCDTGVRAEPLPYGAQTYIDVEFYLAVRSQGLPIESPAVRR